MKQKPLICVIDEDPFVKEGWIRSLKNDAILHFYRDHLELLSRAASEKGLLASYRCLIIGRYYQHINVDIVASGVTEALRASCTGPVFLNWQGYLAKEEWQRKFDGKLFHRYGVRWQTLRLRIQKFSKSREGGATRAPDWAYKAVKSGSKRAAVQQETRPQRCYALLRQMALNASGSHREKIEFYLKHDPMTGMALLEAIYARLATDKDRPATCPSRYINSSPVIAKRMLQEVLF